MSAALSTHEYKQLKKAAKEFGSRAKADHTYYVRVTPTGPFTRPYVSEIRFKKKWPVGLMAGSFSPEMLFIHHGPIYDDRAHPAIANLPTSREMRIADDALEREMFGGTTAAGRDLQKRINDSAVGTAFHRTF